MTAIKNKPINICSIVSYKIYPAIIGGQKGIALFYKYFSKLLPVTIISTKNNETPEQLSGDFLPILSNSATRYINPFLLITLRNIIKKKNITHLILEQPFYGWLGVMAKWFFRIKLIVHSHNIESLRFKSTGSWWWGIMWHYERFVYRQSSINFFISDEDRNYAISKYKLKEKKCHTITYGFDLNTPPTENEKSAAKKSLCLTHNIQSTDKILLFNGTLDYKPNLDAVNYILNDINPLLNNQKEFHYKIIICGKNLPSAYDELMAYKNSNIIYAGFVDDISLYFKGADIFINPVTDGGGIKTKLVEALGNNLFCISTVEGAYGVPVAITGNKLKIVPEKNWEVFAKTIMEINPNAGQINEKFFNHFYWENIAEKAKSVILN